MPYTAEQVTEFPECDASIDANPDEGGVGFIGTSESVGCGHEDSMERMPDPNVEWATTPATPENVNSNPNTPTSTAGGSGD